MVSNTSNHGYRKPKVGGDHDQWGPPQNANIDDFDVDIEIRDLQTNRHDYDPKDGAKYFSSDNGIVYIGDGADWNEVAVPTAGGVIERAPTLLRIESSQSAHFRIRPFESMSLDQLEILDGGSLYITTTEV